MLSVLLYLWAWAGVSIAWRGSRLEPSPIEAKARVFCFLMDLTNPYTSFSALSAGVSSRRAIEALAGLDE